MDIDKRMMTAESVPEWNHALLQQGKFSINSQENMVNSKAMRTRSGFIVAAVGSGSGKTTLVLAILAKLQDLGIKVAPFKAGPDFIDPLWHHAITKDLQSYNLDTFLLGSKSCRTLCHAKSGNRMAVIEGVMGLYDGKSGVGGLGSTADLARTLKLPVILTVNAKGMAGSIVPLVAGFVQFAKGFTIAGVIANRVGSDHHAALLATALEEYNLPPLLGWLKTDSTITLEERHLGLVLPDDQLIPMRKRFVNALTLNVDRLLQCVQITKQVILPKKRPKLRLAGKTIAIACDRAFCFIYPANVEWLESMGATICFFSPLASEIVPVNANALWFPGGYPELHAKALSNSSTWESVHTFVNADGNILAECGGMMALGDELIDHAGAAWRMAGILPIISRMLPRLAGLGYRQEAAGARGHEFHHSIREPCQLPPAFNLPKGDVGIHMRGVRASYIHWYFPSASACCAAWFGTKQ